MLRERPSKGENRSSRKLRDWLQIWRTEGPKVASTQQAKVAAPLVLVEHSENEEKGSNV